MTIARRTREQYNFDACEFDDMRLPSSWEGRVFTSPRTESIQFVVVHHMVIRDTDPNDDEALAKCREIWSTRPASAHYGVDNDFIAQFVSDMDAAYATANRHGNHAGISIEHVNKTLDEPGTENDYLISEKTWKTGAKLAAHLHKLYNLGRPVKNVTLRKHSSFYATSCPGPYMDSIWSQYVAEAQRVYDSIGKPPTPVPTQTPTPTPVPEYTEAFNEISANLAGYDTVGKGAATRVHRAATVIPEYLLPMAPLWFHFQECAIDMVPVLDRKLVGYKRIPEGGKGRESYYRVDKGIKILEAKLVNVKHMLNNDTKPMLVICWEMDTAKAVTVNFHSENQGSTIQPKQLRDVMDTALAMREKHGVRSANMILFGDSNFKDAADYAVSQAWSEAIKSADKKIDLQYHSTNGWVGLTVGRRIDVAIYKLTAKILEAEIKFGKIISDHWPLRVKRRLLK